VHRGELAETYGEIVIRAGEIGAPSGTALLEAIASEIRAAEIEGSVEVFDLGPLRRLAIEAADSAAADPDARLPLRILLAHLIDRRRRGDRNEHRDGERVQQARVPHEGLSAAILRPPSAHCYRRATSAFAAHSAGSTPAISRRIARRRCRRRR